MKSILRIGNPLISLLFKIWPVVVSSGRAWDILHEFLQVQKCSFSLYSNDSLAVYNSWIMYFISRGLYYYTIAPVSSSTEYFCGK